MREGGKIRFILFILVYQTWYSELWRGGGIQCYKRRGGGGIKKDITEWKGNENLLYERNMKGRKKETVNEKEKNKKGRKGWTNLQKKRNCEKEWKRVNNKWWGRNCLEKYKKGGKKKLRWKGKLKKVLSTVHWEERKS